MFEPYRGHPELQRLMRRERPRMYAAMFVMRVFLAFASLVCAGLLFWVGCNPILNKRVHAISPASSPVRP